MSKRILIVGPAWIGDMVMAQSLFKLLAQHQATIDVLAPAWSAPLLARMPEVARLISLPFVHGELNLLRRYQIAKQLRQMHYHQAIVLPNSLKSALIPWLARIPHRTGWIGESRYFLLNDIRRLDKKRYPLMVEQFAALGLPADATLPRSLPQPSLAISPSAKEILKKFSLTTQQPVLILCPGAEFGPAKQWPADYFAQVANKQLAKNWSVWLLGTDKDKAITNKIQFLTQNHCVDLAGQTTLTEAIDLLSMASGVISNDSGLMHIAAALNKPLVVVYGATSPAFTPPLSATAKVLQHHLPCQPCHKRTCPLTHHDCMNLLKPEQVEQAMKAWK